MWKTCSLSDACSINNGGTPKSKVSEYWGDEIPWLTPKDMGQLSSRYVSQTARQITSSGLGNSSAKLIPSNSVIISCRAPIGHVAINEVPMSFNQGCKGLTPRDDVSTEYLYYFLLASKQLLNDLGTGATFKEISTKTLASVPIPLPPLTEQERIVAKLDEAFADIEKAIENTEKNLVNATELFESYVSLILSSPKGHWERGRLGGFVENISTGPFGSMLHKSDYIENGIPLINPINLQGGKIVPDKRKAVGQETQQRLQQYQVSCNDVVVARRGELGRCAVVTGSEDGWLCGTGSFFIRTSARLNPNVLTWMLRSSSGREKLAELSGGAVMPNLSNKALSSMVVDVPPSEEQDDILVKISEMDSKISDVASRYSQKVSLLHQLKNAILAETLRVSD
jgi:type I restriction enzyme, S subunit